MTISAEAKALVAQVNKQFGEGAVVIGSDIKVHKRFTSGSLSLDVALGGGWPANQPIEIVGRESHGKTMIVYKTIAANQAINPEFTVFWLAAEHYDVDQAAALGVDNDRVIVHHTQAMEHALDTLLKFAASRSVDCVVLDSYPALIPDEEAEKDMDEAVVAIGARLLGKFFRKGGAAFRRSLTDDEDRPLLGPIIINQYRDKIGGFSPRGTPQTTPGGNAKNYAFYVRVEVKREDWIKDKIPGKGLEIKVGQTVKFNTIKNKSAPPQQIASVDFYFRDAPTLPFKRGDIDVVKEIVVMGILFDVLKQRGAWISFDNGHYDDKNQPVNRFNGRNALVEALRADLTLQEEVSAAVYKALAEKGESFSVEEDAVEAAETAGTTTIRRKRSSPAAETAAEDSAQEAA